MKKLCSLLLVFTSGCSAFVPSKQQFYVTCQQPGTYVSVNGHAVTPPGSIAVLRNKPVYIVALHNGYAPYSDTIGHHLNVWAALDIVGGVCWIGPYFGLNFAGSRSLDETHLDITLYQTSASTK
jgi:hypothetical protein